MVSFLHRVKTGAWHLVLAFLLAVVAAPAQAQSQGPQPASVQWTSLEKAVKSAKSEHKGIFVMVYADWCGYCHRMEATTFRDPTVVAKMNSGFVAAKVNGESPKAMNLGKRTLTENQWAVEQGVQGFPSLIVLDQKQRVVVQFPGFMTSAQATVFLRDVSDFLKAGGIDKLGEFLPWAEKRS